MTSQSLPAWPKKTRELQNHHFDSTIWNELAFRDDDIVISTYAKSGTTWVQQIVAQLLFQGADDLDVAEMSPWLDLRVARLPLGGTFWDGGLETFIHKGTNGRWRERLTDDDVSRYETRARAELGDDCASWLEGPNDPMR